MYIALFIGIYFLVVFFILYFNYRFHNYIKKIYPEEKDDYVSLNKKE